MKTDDIQQNGRTLMLGQALLFIPVIFILAVPIVNVLVGLKALPHFAEAALLAKRGKISFASLLLSAPVGLALTIAGLAIGGVADPMISGLTLWIFVTGPAGAGLAAAMVLAWPDQQATR